MDRRRFGAGAVAMAVCAFAGAGAAQAASRNGVHAYLVRGTMGLSPGLEELGEKLKRRGILATVHSLEETSTLAAEAAQKYKSGRERQIVLIGHSMGGTAVLSMAEKLDRAGVPVALAILLDAPDAMPVPANVRRIVNLYISNGAGVPVERGRGFQGSLRNVDLKNDPEMGHFAISSSGKIHQQVIRYVLGAIAGPAAPSEKHERASSAPTQANRTD